MCKLFICKYVWLIYVPYSIKRNRFKSEEVYKQWTWHVRTIIWQDRANVWKVKRSKAENMIVNEGEGTN